MVINSLCAFRAEQSATNPQIPGTSCKTGAEINPALYSRLAGSTESNKSFLTKPVLNSWEPVLIGSRLLAANDLFVIYISMSGKYGLIALTEYC